jgi:alpha-mannosidase
VYEDSEQDFLRLSALGNEVLDASVDALAAGIGLDSNALVVFNPSPHPSADYVEVTAAAAADLPLPSQPTADGGALVWCEGVPPNGYRAVQTGAAPSLDNPLRASRQELDTPFWHIQLDDRGRITRLTDKVNAREVLQDGESANRLVIFEDKPLNFDAWDIDAFFHAKSREVDQLESIDVRESGPERAMLELQWRTGERTRIRQRLCVYARSPRIDFQTHVEWQERQSLLKVAFATNIRSRRATYEIQFGTIERPTHRNTSWEEAAFEVPAQRWADLSDAEYGVAVLADCKHGYIVHDRTLWLTLLKGAIDPDPDADRGSHEFTYSLLPHLAGLDGVRQAAYGLTRPLIWRREPAHPGGKLPQEFSAAHASSDSVLVETVKWAEDEDAMIVRLYEAEGGATNTTLSIGAPTDSVAEVDLLERNAKSITLAADGSVPLVLRAHEIKTLCLTKTASHTL